MDTKILELTDKIYKEGIEKGNQEAARIIEETNKKKLSMIEDAKKEAASIVDMARKEAAGLKENTEAELRLFASQALEALKSEVTNLVTGELASSNVKAAMADASFMREMILEIAKEWSKKESIVIQTSQSEALSSYFEANTKDLLNKGVKIEQVNGKPTNFTLIPAGASYKVTFGEDEFIAFFKEFLRPQLVEKLF